MIRIGLSVYLMLAMLAGPWLCCCQLSRLSARFVTLLRHEKAKPAENHHSCCQHRVPEKDSQPANPPDAPTCPCQGSSQEPPALVLLESDGAGQLDHDPTNAQAGELLDCGSLPGFVTPSFNLTLNAVVASSPVLAGRDMLSSLHILRC